MTEKSSHASFHCSDEQLLSYQDGELPRTESARVRAHLANCVDCSGRMAKIQSALAGFSEAHLHSHSPSMDVSGPRAQLKARLAEMMRSTKPDSSRQLSYVRGLAYACALVLMVVSGLWILRHQVEARSSGYSRMLPDPGFTPGATREVALADLCATDSDEVVRSVPSSLQERVFQEYGIRGVPAEEFEVDYLITPGLGGSDDVRNLWPEPHSNTMWNSYVKDQLEDHLHRMVCQRKIGLSEAQREIASNWIAAYRKYFRTDQPLANASPARPSETFTADTRSLPPIFVRGLWRNFAATLSRISIQV
jgi:hypothetical protein